MKSRFLFSILTFTLTSPMVEAQSTSRVPSFTVSGDRNPETGKSKIEATFTFNSVPDENFQRFFQTYSLSDFNKIPEEARSAALALLVAFKGELQDHDLLDSQTIRDRQTAVLKNYFDTAPSNFQNEINRAAFGHAVFYNTTEVRSLYSVVAQKDPEYAKSQICGRVSFVADLYIGTSEIRNLQKISEQASSLEALIQSHPEMANYKCFENSSVLLKDYIIALRTNTPLNKSITSKKPEPTIPPISILKDCTKQNIQFILSDSADSLVNASNGTIAYLGSSMKGCRLEGKIVKEKGTLYFNSKFSGKSDENIPLIDLAKAWGLQLSTRVQPTSEPAAAQRSQPAPLKKGSR